VNDAQNQRAGSVSPPSGEKPAVTVAQFTASMLSPGASNRCGIDFAIPVHRGGMLNADADIW